jgi:hypothetical protein
VSSTAADVDVRAAVSQVETNVDVDPAAFTVPVRDEKPMTLDELRASRKDGSVK